MKRLAHWIGMFVGVAGSIAGAATVARANTVVPGARTSLPTTNLAVGSTVLLRGTQSQTQAANATVEIDGVAGTATPRAIGSHPDDDDVALSISPTPRPGDEILLTYPGAEGGDSSVAFTAVAPDTIAPTTPDVYVRLSEFEHPRTSTIVRDVTYEIDLQHRFDAGGAWEVIHIQAFDDTGARLASQLHRSAPTFAWSPAAADVSSDAAAGVCFKLQAIDGAGQSSDVVDACVDEDERFATCSIGAGPRGGRAAVTPRR